MSDESTIPAHAGLGLAAVILGAVCLPLVAYVGMKSFVVALPVFGLWFFLPVVVLAIVLGMLASRTAKGIAGATLGVAALLLCLCFTFADRMYGPQIRAQLKPAQAAPGLNVDQILKMKPMGGLPTTRPG